jgi:hypothetical protein
MSGREKLRCLEAKSRNLGSAKEQVVAHQRRVHSVLDRVIDEETPVLRRLCASVDDPQAKRRPR